MTSSSAQFDLIMPTRVGWALMLRPLRAKKRRCVKQGQNFSGRFTMACSLIWAGTEEMPSTEIVIGLDITTRITDGAHSALSEYGLELVSIKHLRHRDTPFGKNDAMLAYFEIEVK